MQQSHYANNYTQINSLTMLERDDTGCASDKRRNRCLTKIQSLASGVS